MKLRPYFNLAHTTYKTMQCTHLTHSRPAARRRRTRRRTSADQPRNTSRSDFWCLTNRTTRNFLHLRSVYSTPRKVTGGKHSIIFHNHRSLFHGSTSRQFQTIRSSNTADSDFFHMFRFAAALLMASPIFGTLQIPLPAKQIAGGDTIENSYQLPLKTPPRSKSVHTPVFCATV